MSAKANLALIGLGRMGANMARRLSRQGLRPCVFDVDKDVARSLAEELSSDWVADLSALTSVLSAPRIVWLMVPHGVATQQATQDVLAHLEPGDIIIDGGNSRYSDSQDRAKICARQGVIFLDVGTSGGVFGLERGYCLMVGGDAAAVKTVSPIFEALAPGLEAAQRTPGRKTEEAVPAERGWHHCGPSGAGHFAKMIHNGIEYGMMQAFAEGFGIFAAASAAEDGPFEKFDFDKAAIAETWRRGSVVSSWILDLTADAFIEQPDLAPFSAQVQDSGEGRWTVETAVDLAVSAPVLTSALFARFRSRQSDETAERTLSAMRFKFGGHVAPPPVEDRHDKAKAGL